MWKCRCHLIQRLITHSWPGLAFFLCCVRSISSHPPLTKPCYRKTIKACHPHRGLHCTHLSHWQRRLPSTHTIWNGNDSEFANCAIWGNQAITLTLISLSLESCGASHTGSTKTLPSVLATHNKRGPGREKKTCRPTIRAHSPPANSVQLENGTIGHYSSFVKPLLPQFISFQMQQNVSENR